MDFYTKNDIIYQKLKDMIIDGILKPGERIIISELAAEFNVSPMPVREAIKRLQQDKYVEVIPHIGAKVASFELDKLKEILLIVIEMEILASRLAAPYISDQQIKQLEEIIREMELAINNRNSLKYARLDKELHGLVYDASSYKYLYELIRDLWNKSEMYRAVFTKSIDRPQASLQEHKAWIEALKEKDVEKAQAILRKHKESAFQIFVEIYENSQE
ncbi:MAG: GntR family transcriptional regulator [Bacillota bacterium]